MRLAALASIAAAAILVSACERPQQVAYKDGHYAGKPDTPVWDDARFNHDRAEWERRIKARNHRQNEYERTSGKGG